MDKKDSLSVKTYVLFYVKQPNRRRIKSSDII